MLIHESYVDAVGFLYVDQTEESNLVGTGFIVSVKYFGSSSFFHLHYVVTSKHVTQAPGKTLLLRLNKKEGEADLSDAIQLPKESWYFHSDTDIAIHRINLKGKGFQFKAIDSGIHAREDSVKYDDSFGLFVSSTNRDQLEIGVGDDLFFVGHFSKFFGKDRNFPLVRFGTIALMPQVDQKVKVVDHLEGHKEVEAYLVEAKSWGGQSGSPVFVYFTPHRRYGMLEVSDKFGDRPRLLGILGGHYDIPTKIKSAKKSENLAGELDKEEVPINAGIAWVVPTQALLALLLRQDVKEDYQSMGEQQDRGTN